MTKKSELYSRREKEKRESRIADTRNFILNSSLSSLMNNLKWCRIFNLIEQRNEMFEFKTLRSSDYIKSNMIYEVEDTSFLTDKSDGFVEFLELDQLIFKSSSEFHVELNNMNIEFKERSNETIITGYRA